MVWTTPFEVIELDELYWFTGRKANTETRENTYIMTMVAREPRQIVDFDVAFDKSPERIEEMVNRNPPATVYCTDGYFGYMSVVFPGKHIRNDYDKSDTYTAESVNADLRHYIPLLARRSRCFPRKLETLHAVLELFASAYNKYGIEKLKHRVPVKHKSAYPAKHLHKFKELPFSVLDFL